MGILGLADDLADVSPASRLAIEAVAGALVVGLLWADQGPIALLGAGIAAVTIPLCVNATNMVDNADGLAAGLSIITGLALAGMSVMLDSRPLVLTALVVPAAALGFLVYNMPPARVFMGDVGSLAIGFMLAVVSAMVLREALTSSLLTPALILALPAAWAMQLGDLGMVLVTRLRRGVSPMRGGVDHTSHRLMRSGFSPAGMLAVVVGLAIAAAVVGLVAFASGSAIIAFMLIAMVAIVVVTFQTVLASRVPHV
jgi:UDP-GlcNAc:undecaprenyl-phosphate GlcNAc-1-phosphate transferase